MSRASLYPGLDGFASSLATRLAFPETLRYGGDEAESQFVLEPADSPLSNGGRTYYSIADQLALEISFGLPGPNETLPMPDEVLSVAIDLSGALSRFVQGALSAYVKLRGVEPHFQKADEDR